MEKKEVRQQFEFYLRNKGKIMTKERSTILDFILLEEAEFTANDICASSQNGDISQATVYNTINYLVDCELIEKVPTIGIATKFRLKTESLLCQ